MTKPLQILIIGAGAIGLLVGGKLALAGNAVTLAGRPRIAEAINRAGLRLIEPSGEQTIRNLRVTGSIADAFLNTNGPFDLIILTVKSYDTDAALSELQAAQPQVDRLPPLLSLQNGVGNEETIEAKLQTAAIIAGNITTPVSLPDVGVIRVEKAKYGIGVALWKGEHNQAGQAVIGVELLASVLSEAGFKVTIYPNAQGMKWTKLLLNMVGNASSAILDERPALAFADPQIVDLELAAWRETLRVMHVAKIPVMNMDGYPLRWVAPLIPFLPNTLLRPIFRKLVAGGRGQKMPSLQIDLSNNKGKSEINWLNGAVVAKGKAVGVATPVNQLLSETLQNLVSQGADRPEGNKVTHEALGKS